MPGLVTTEFAQNVRGEGGAVPPPWSPAGQAPQVQTPEEVAEAVANLIEHPAAEIFTNPAHATLVKRYFDDVGAFEQSM